MAKDKKKKKQHLLAGVSFAGVETGGSTLPEGKYTVEVTEITRETSDDSGNDYLNWEFGVVEPKKLKGKKLWRNTSLTQNSLWALRGLLEAMGIEVPDDAEDIDTDELIGKTVGVEVGHELYNKKNRAQIIDFFEEGSSDEDEVEEDEDEAPKKKSKKKDEDEVEEEEEKPKKKKGKSKTYTSDGILELDEEGLQELIEEHALEVDLEEYNTLRKKRASVVEAMEEAGLIED